MFSRRPLSNPWLLGAAILAMTGLITALLPDGTGMGPSDVSAKPGRPARRRPIGPGYGEMRFRPATEPAPTTQKAPAPVASQPATVAPEPAPIATEPAPVAQTQETIVSEPQPVVPAIIPATKPVIENPPHIATTNSADSEQQAEQSAGESTPPAESQAHLTDRWLSVPRSK